MPDLDTEQKLFEELEAETTRRRLAEEEEEEETEEEEAEFAEFEEAAEEEEFEEEEEASRLALAQGIQQEVYELQKQGETYKHPSGFKYSILFSIAIVGDLVDIALYLTGVGILISFFVSAFFLALLAAIFWFTDTKFKRAQDYIKLIETELPRLTAAIETSALRWGRRGFRFGRMVKRGGFGKVGAKIMRVSARVAQVGKKNPLTKIVLLGLANIAPIVTLFPLNFISVLLSRRDERKTYEQARESSQQLGELSENAAEVV